MVYYNLYRILKDIIKTLFRNKIFKQILIAFLIAIVIILLDRNSVKASTTLTFTSLKNISYTIPSFDDIMEQYPQFDTSVCIKRTSGNINLILCQDLSSSRYSPTFSDSYTPYDMQITHGGYRLYRLQNNEWIFLESGTSANFLNIDDLICSNIDLYNFNSQDRYLVFSANMNAVTNPVILTSLNDIESLIFDVLRINAKSFSQQDLYLLCYDKNFENTDSLKNLYPINEILLNQQSKYFIPERTENIETDAIYWIDRNELGFNWSIGNTYSFRFALRVPIENDFSNWEYEYLGEPFNFTISSNVLQTQIDDLNAQTKESQENQRHEETIGSINNINNFLNSDTNEQTESEIDGLMGITSDNEELKNINTSFFSRFSSFLLTFLDYNLQEDEILEIPLPHSNQKIQIHSNIISSHVSNTISTLIGMLWMYIFTLYGIKFCNNLLIAIQEGDIIDPNKSLVGAVKGEVILSNML